MGSRTLHLHMPRLGVGLPTKTVRPFARRGDAIVGAFLRTLEEPAERVLITGRLFHRESPPAHLVDRVAAALGEIARSGVPVSVPGDTPRGLLFVAAGVRLGDPPDADGAPEFWQSGAYRVLNGGICEKRRIPVPGVREVRIDVTGLTAAALHERLRARLGSARGARLVRVVLTGRSDDPEVRAFGPRELHHHLPGDAEGVLRNDLAGPPAVEPGETDEDERRAALVRARRRLPELPTTTGIYEFVDDFGHVLYVGKAVNLRRRVASHYTAEVREASPRGPMLAAARTVRYRELPTEVEALLAEAERIREARPPYNRHMRETENARYLRADLDAPFPALSSQMGVEPDGAVYFGPFAKRWMVERSLRVLMVVYGLRSCCWRAGEPAPVACTDRDLGLCSAPCRGRISPGHYRARVRAALDHLTGGTGREPPFGSLNPPAAGMLTTEDLRIFHGFVRSARWFLGNLDESCGTIRVAGGRVLLVLGGLRAGIRSVKRGRRARVEGWAAERIEEFRSRPARTWVRPEQAEEVRILSAELRRQERTGVPSPPAGEHGMDSLP